MRASHAITGARPISPPAGLEGSPPREVRLTGGGRALIVAAWFLGVAAIAAGGALSFEARRQSSAVADMDRRSVTTTAVVDRLWRGSGDGRPAFAAFHFDATGTRIDGQSRLQVSAWRELRPGSTIRVRYLPDDPSRFTVDGARRNTLPPWLAYFVSSMLAGLAVLCGAAVRSQRTLLSEGRVARATVTKVDTHGNPKGGSHRALHYEFPLLGGGRFSGKAAVASATDVGSTIWIVYDPERPKHNRPYPFTLVEPAH